MATKGRKHETLVLQGDEGSIAKKMKKEKKSAGGEEHNGALVCARQCLLFAESLECGQGEYHVLYRKGVCTRAAVTLLYPFSLSLSSVSSADLLSPRGPAHK